MVNEPCPVCNAKDPNAYLRCNHPMCTDGRHITRKPVETTRPAAQVEGLETYMRADFGTIDLVPRSQAEAIIAAKAQTIEGQRRWIAALEANNAALTARVNGFEGFLDDLAEILGCERDIGDVVNELDAINNRAEALEAQLAAARKALETEKALADRLASALEYIDDYSLSYPDLGTVTAVAQPALEAHSAARATLEGQP